MPDIPIETAVIDTSLAGSPALPDIPVGLLCVILGLMILLSALFSGSETSMMALNRYRLRNLVEKGHRGAKRASKLLDRPDRLIGLILLGNNFVNILATSIATIIAVHFLGSAGVMVSTVLLTVVILVFAEVLPKTLAALHPERVAFPASIFLTLLMKLLYPFVWVLNGFTNRILKLFGVDPEETANMSLDRDELRTVVKEASSLIPRRHKSMLFGILDLEQVIVEDIMIPRSDIQGIDISEDSERFIHQLRNIRHTLIPVYRGHIDNVIGILHARKAPRLLDGDKELNEASLQQVLREPYFVPIGTPLHTQLFNFQRAKQRMGLVVDEYGDIQGMVTLEDILEEIVGEFTTDAQTFNRGIFPQEDGSYLLDASFTIRELNKKLKWKLPVGEAKTLNGLVFEALESIPEPGTTLRINDYTIEVVQVADQQVKNARVTPPNKTTTAPTEAKS